MTCAVMIDIETLGIRPTSIIASIGAVVFDIDEDITKAPNFLRSFYKKIDIVDCQANGLTIDADTVKFWITQDFAVKADLLNTKERLRNVLLDLSVWWTVDCQLSKSTSLWCHGPSFDAVILENAFRVCELEVPWAYNSPRDTRTIFELAGVDIKKEVRGGIFHNALEDCIFQVQMVQKAWKRLKDMSGIDTPLPVSP